MTDLELQKILADELKKMCASESLKKLNGEVWKDYNIYIQSKPAKDDGYYDYDINVSHDDEQEDYILVVLDEEDLRTDEVTGQKYWKTSIQFIVSIADTDVSNQGNLVIANLLNQIFKRFSEEAFTRKQYEMLPEAYKRYNHECLIGYYEGALITYWKIPVEDNKYTTRESSIGDFI